jgi:hypothetical protein
MGIPALVLAKFQRFAETTYDKTGEIHRPSRIENDEGGHATSWNPIAAGVKFSVAEGFSGQNTLEGPILERIGTRVPYQLTFEDGFDIDEDDRVYQTFPETRTFEVVGVPNKGVSNQGATRVIAIERG